MSLLGLACAPGTAAGQQAEFRPLQRYGAASYLPLSMRDLLAPASRRNSPGLRMGSFTLLAEAGASIVCDDNVFARPSGREGDSYKSADAGVALVSNWSRHALELYAGGGGNFYADFDSEDVGYATAGAAGRLDAYKDLWLTAFAKYAFGYEPRGSGESFREFEEPIETRSFEGGVIVHKHFNRLWAEIAGTVRREEYSDAKVRAGGSITTVDQSFRDGTVDDIAGRVGYDLSTKTSLFVEGHFQLRDHNDNRFDGVGYKTLAGFRYEFTHLVSAEAAFGYLGYDPDYTLETIDTWTYRAQLRYDLSPLMTVALAGSRDVGSPSGVDLGSNRIHSEIGVRGDYAIRRDVTLMAAAGYGWVDYVDGSRKDDYLSLTTGTEYMLRPWLSLWTNYAYLHYESNAVPAIDYDKNVFTVAVRARY